MTTMQRIPTIEEAEAIYYDEINAYELLCQIQDWLGLICQADFDFGWEAFKRGLDRECLTNEAQRHGFDQAIACYDEDIAFDREMREGVYQR